MRVRPLWWTTTPVTGRYLGQHEPGDSFPVSGITHDEATAIAARLAGRLPRSAEWEWMAAGSGRRRFPWGSMGWRPSRAALLPSGHASPVPAGTHPEGATPDGVLDVAGNVWEWTASPVMGNGFVIRGGSYASPPLYAQTTFLNAVPAELRSAGIGVRVVRDA
ncbi:MAG: formylglycine-generating enzyme family protein [Streptosporangiaceae bacterium]